MYSTLWFTRDTIHIYYPICSSYHPFEIGIIIAISQMKKMRLEEVDLVWSGHTLFCGLPASILPFVMVPCVSFRNQVPCISATVIGSTWAHDTSDLWVSSLELLFRLLSKLLRWRNSLNPWVWVWSQWVTTKRSIILYIKFKPAEENSASPVVEIKNKKECIVNGW